MKCFVLFHQWEYRDNRDSSCNCGGFGCPQHKEFDTYRRCKRCKTVQWLGMGWLTICVQKSEQEWAEVAQPRFSSRARQ